MQFFQMNEKIMRIGAVISNDNGNSVVRRAGSDCR